MKIKDYEFKLTSIACPEQYDVYDVDGNQVAYVRLRYGELYAACPDCGGDVVYSAKTDGHGSFYSDAERMHHLNAIADAIMAYGVANKKIDIDTVRSNCNSFGEYAEIIDTEAARIERYTCPHTNKKGMMKVDFLGGGTDMCICKKCGTKFNLALVDDTEFKKSYATIMDVLNQIKVFGFLEKPELVKRVGLLMGEIDTILGDGVYEKIVKSEGGLNG